MSESYKIFIINCVYLVTNFKLWATHLAQAKAYFRNVIEKNKIITNKI